MKQLFFLSLITFILASCSANMAKMAEDIVEGEAQTIEKVIGDQVKP